MKIGCQTIIFGRNIDNLDWVLANIANLGFTGVEFFQHPNRIWVYDHVSNQFRHATIEDIVIRLRQYGLTFLGMASGTLQDRIEFCLRADPSVRTRRHISDDECMPLYQYAEELSDADTALAVENRVNLGFHPHAFTRFERFAQAKPFFDESNPHLFWLPDTAHMAVVGEDPVQVLAGLLLDKIIAVHLKGYEPAYGRAYHRYAKGFVPLSDTNGAALQCIKTLEARGYSGWYVVEQDFSHTDPITSLSKSASWLAEHGYLSGPRPDFDLTETGVPIRPLMIPRGLERDLSTFTRDVYRASDAKLDACYQSIARSVVDLVGAEHASLWSWNQPRLDVRLVASHPSHLHTHNEPWRIKSDSDVVGVVKFPMDAEEAPIPELTDDAGRPLVSYSRAAQETNAGYTFTMAIPNLYNPHAIHLLICGITKEKSKYDYHEIVELIADDVGRAVNTALDDACALAAATVNLAADQHTETCAFLESIAATAKAHINCEATSIFLLSRGGERLECRYDKEIVWRAGLVENERCYRANEMAHPTVKCWQECRIILTDQDQDESGGSGKVAAKSREVVPPQSEEHNDILLVPLVAVTRQPDGGSIASAIGVIRCRNKKTVECPGGVLHRPYFTDDDAAILSAMCQAAVPHIDTLLRDEGLTANIAGMTHELNMPVNTLQAAVDRLQTLLRRKDYSTVEDLAEDMISWTGLMGKIIDMVDLFGKKNVPLEPECERLGLFGDVIAPLKPVMKKLLDNRRFSVDSITYAPFETLPLLYLDRSLFQMVFFNLFSNAIKYAFEDRNQFRVRIDAEFTGGEYCIHFSDYGPGISESYANTIFEHGMRGPTSVNKLVKGMGLGLWVVRRIVEAHEGRVAVTSYHNPTTITIFLPESRRSSAPPKPRKAS